MFAVASSNIRILLFFKIARARQTSCRWPELKFDPPSAIVVSRPSVKSLIWFFNSTWRSDLSIRWLKKDQIILSTCSSDRQISSSLLCPKGSKLSRKLPTNKIGSCGMIDIFSRNVCRPKVLMSTSSISIAPSVIASSKMAWVMLLFPAPVLRFYFVRNFIWNLT